MTYTYAVLEVSRTAYDEILAKLAAAGYQHAFHDDGGSEVVDMHGIALRAAETPVARCHCGHTEAEHRHRATSRDRICLVSSCRCRYFAEQERS